MISYVLEIDGSIYVAEIGAEISLDGTEEFDSGLLVIRNITKEEEFTEADDVRLLVGSKEFNLIVQADRVDRVTETKYDHTITLTEETAKLTKLYSGDRFYSLNGTDLFTHKEILEREIATSPIGGTFPYSVATATYTALDINSPQKKFEGLNFFEKVQDLMRGIKAVPRMTSGVITHNYYNKSNNPITLSTLTGWQKNNEFNNYATTVISRGRNLTYDLDNTTGATWWPSKTEAASPRSSQGKYADETAQYQLGLDIRRIIKGYLINVEIAAIDVGVPRYVDMDIEIVSKEEWDGLPLGTNNVNTMISSGEKYQRNTLYYTIGSNTIEGMALDFKDSTLATRTHIEMVIRCWLEQNGYDGEPVLGDYIDDDINNRLLRVQYQPYVNATISAEKWDTEVSKVSAILNNQKDTTLDIGRYAPVMDTIANRLANGDWLITIAHEDETEILELYDYTSDGYKVIKATYEFYNSQIIGTYQLSLRWATLDGYQSVYKNTDPFTIGRDNVESNFLYREFLEFSTTSRTNTGSLTAQGYKTLLNIFDYDSADDLQADVGIFDSSENTYDIGIDVMGTGGNGIRLISTFREPKNAGYELDRTDDGYASPISYTNEAGYMASFQLDYVDDYVTTTSDREDEFPKITGATYTALASLPSLTVHKNPNEILGFNYELIPCTDESDIIIVYNDFSKFNNLVNDGSVSGLYIYYSLSTTVYDKFDTLPKEVQVSEPLSGATISKTLGYIDISAIPISTNVAWAVGTADKLLFAVNYDGTARERIYINNLKERSTTESL